MEKVYDIDYASLDNKSKIEFVHHFSNLAKKSFNELPLRTSWLVQLLFLTRCWNSYSLMDVHNSTPKVLYTAIDLLWKFMDEQADMEELISFQKGFSASLLNVMTGDTCEIEETEQNGQFYKQYFYQWNDFYNIFSDTLCSLFEQVVNKTVNWGAIENMIYADIGDDKIEYFEEVYNNAAGVNSFAERECKTYKSLTFCRVIALCQRDMKEALADNLLVDLYERYKKEYIFSPEQCKKYSELIKSRN